MNILVLNYEYPPLGGGGAPKGMHISGELAKKHFVYFLTTGWDKFGVSEENGYTINRLKTSRKYKHVCTNREMLSFLWHAWRALPPILQEHKFDVAHIYFAVPTGILAFHPKLRKIPFILSVGGSDVPWHNPTRFRILYAFFTPIIKAVWSRARRVVCNSSDLKKEVLSFSPQLNISVIQNGTKTDVFHPADKRADGGPFVILYAGRLIPLKRIHLVIQALPEIIRGSGRQVLFRVVGEGSSRAGLETLAQRSGVKGSVEFIGRREYGEMPEIYRGADLYVQLSEIEGMSNTILEAMSSGLPVITTRVGGAGDIVSDNGAVVDNVSTKVVADLITGYVNDHQLAARQGKRSREIAESMSWSKVSLQYEKELLNASL
ncbi:MAG: glycosyltransferase family 4 protein [Elusimicrobiaceae bacterium]